MVNFMQLLKDVESLTITEVLELQDVLDEKKFVLGISKYGKGKIYGIWNIVTGELAYVGSTIKVLRNRWSGHKSFFKTSPNSAYTQYIMSQGGAANFFIKLIEDYPCKSFAELLAKEKYHINSLKPICNQNLVDTIQDEIDNQDDAIEEFITDEPVSAYATTSDIDEEKYVASCHASRSHRLSMKDQTEAKKYWFLHEVVNMKDADEAVKASVFDESQNDKTKERILYQKFAEMSYEPEQIQSPNPYSHKFPHLPSILKGIKIVCDILGLKNTHDCTVSIDDSILTTHEEILKPELLKLTELLRIRVDQGKSSSESQMRRLLSSVFHHFSGAKLVSIRERKQNGKNASGKRMRTSYYKSNIHVEDGFFADVIYLLQC